MLADEPARSALDFDQIVAAHQARVARLASRLLGWRGDVDDVVQDVFLAALRSIGKFRGESSVETWLVRVTINACRREIRRRAMREMLWGKALSREAAEGMADDERTKVREVVGALPRKYRVVVVLRYLEEMEVAQVMSSLKLSRSAVEVRLHRAREMLRDGLKDYVEGT